MTSPAVPLSALEITEAVLAVFDERDDWTAGELADRLGKPHATSEVGSALAKLARRGEVWQVTPFQQRRSPITGAMLRVWRRPLIGRTAAAHVNRHTPPRVRQLLREVERLEVECPLCRRRCQTRLGLVQHLERVHGAKP